MLHARLQLVEAHHPPGAEIGKPFVDGLDFVFRVVQSVPQHVPQDISHGTIGFTRETRKALSLASRQGDRIGHYCLRSRFAPDAAILAQVAAPKNTI
ncbi:MAG: hypothetical protein ACREVG_03015 [Burkholderiales bacterium]